MTQHFVTFYSPGTFVHETSTEPISSWDVEAVKEMARSVKERYGATPFGFRVKARATEADRILVSNMESNQIERVVTNDNSWRIALPLKPDDVILQWP